jgi:hypothetical protein
MPGKGQRRREKNYRTAHGGESRLPPPPKLRELEALPSKLRRLIAIQNKQNTNANASAGALPFSSTSYLDYPTDNFRNLLSHDLLLLVLLVGSWSAMAGGASAPGKQDNKAGKNKPAKNKVTEEFGYIHRS